MKEVIFTLGDFTLVKDSYTGASDIPHEELNMISEGAAEKHIVEVRWTDYVPKSNGQSVKYRYAGVYIGHGMRMDRNSFAETEEFIQVLQDALEFAKLVEKYIHENDWAWNR